MTSTLLARSLAAALLAVAALLPAVAMAADQAPILLAAEEEETSEEPAVDSGAAVDAEPESEPEADPPWTTRFLVPTVLALAVLGILASVAYYAVRIRSRYTVVE